MNIHIEYQTIVPVFIHYNNTNTRRNVAATGFRFLCLLCCTQRKEMLGLFSGLCVAGFSRNNVTRSKPAEVNRLYSCENRHLQAGHRHHRDFDFDFDFDYDHEHSNVMADHQNLYARPHTAPSRASVYRILVAPEIHGSWTENLDKTKGKRNTGPCVDPRRHGHLYDLPGFFCCWCEGRPFSEHNRQLSWQSWTEP